MWLYQIYAIEWFGPIITFGTEETDIITVAVDENNMNINIYGIYSYPDLTDIQK
jgi:hypothetical protein